MSASVDGGPSGGSGAQTRERGPPSVLAEILLENLALFFLPRSGFYFGFVGTYGIGRVFRLNLH
jgi:hypothetical protein